MTGKAMAAADTTTQQQGDDSWYSKHEAWIKANIKQRDCHIFKSEAYGEDCVCGKSKEDHAQSHDKGRWKKEVNTQTAVTTAFGTTQIGDDEDEERHEIQFVRIDEDTPFKHIKHLLIEVWNINEPKWILPLIGSQTDDPEIETQMKEEISFLFQKLSSVSDLWILSDGLEEGISEYILEAKAEASYEDRITSIGCSSWTEGLMEKGNESGCFEYKTEREIFSIGKTMSHMMLVDNGTVDEYLCILSNSSFLTKIIAGLSVPEDASRAIPAVAILFCGDLYTLETIRNYLRENIPVVIVKDSGCVANAFCYAMETSKGVSQRKNEDRNERFGTVISQRSKEELSNMLKTLFHDEEVDEYVQVILQCLQRRDLLSVVDLSTEGALFQGIMSAIVRTKTSTDLISMVDEYLPTPVYSRKTKEKAEKHIENKRADNYKDFEDAENIVKMVFKEAILQEKSECVEFLLDWGVSAVDDVDMLELYQKTDKGLQKTVSEILHKTKKEYDLNRILDFVTEDKQDTPDRFKFVKELCKQQKRDYRKEIISQLELAQAVIRLFTDRILEQFGPRVFVSKEQNTDSIQKGETRHNTGETVEPEEKPMGGEIFTQLFLWAVLTNRNVVARHFWTRGQDLIVSALVAGTIMDSIADKTYNSRKKEIRKANASFYRSLTIGTMDACYWDHKKTTVKLIDKRIKDNSWGIDFLALAFESKNSSIFNSEGMVFYTLSKWYGDIPKSTSMLTLLLCTLCPPFIWLFLKEKSGSNRKSDSHKGPQAGQEMNTSTKKTSGCCSRLGTYYSTPVIKYTSYLLVYCIFLGLYAHFMLIVLTLEFKWNWEIPLIVWMLAFFVEETIQIAQFNKEHAIKSRKTQRGKSSGRRFHNLQKNVLLYFQDEWNVLDMCCIVGFIIGYSLRWSPATYSHGRLFLSINCMCFIWRFLQTFTLSKTIGPMLYMMFKMVKDLLPFLVILCVALFSYAVSTEAILYPNSVWSFDFVLRIPVTAFWLIFGELGFLSELENCSGPTCPSSIGRTFVPYFTAVYMIMTNVLLLNLLIARFNHIFDEVRGNSGEVWARQRCSLMLEYESKPPLPMPFSIIWRIFSTLCSCMCNSKCRKKKQEPSDAKTDVAETPSQDDYNYNCDTLMTDLNFPGRGNEVTSVDYGDFQEMSNPPVTILPGQCNLSETPSDIDGSCQDDLEAGGAIDEEGGNDQQTEVNETDGAIQDGDTQLDDEDYRQQTVETQEPEHSDDNEYYTYMYSYGTDSEVCSDDDMGMEYYPSEEETEMLTVEHRRKGDMNLDEFEKANAELYLHERVN
ncbi:transient receptor potential cation channel subfamily M member 2-like [Haliotis asinina]|uniref:transient receptor potential cation channel subfamily M member 2-like n=1 Tax=Haliotis asinina TaxID=109174 RepID=UPI0035327340